MSKNGFSLLPQLVHCTALIIHLGHASTTHHLATSPPLAHLCMALTIFLPNSHQHSTNIEFCVCTHIYYGPIPLNPPPSSPSPLSWATYHQSPGVLCAQPEWLGWALPFIAVLGAAACVLLQHHRHMRVLSPAEQACTYFHP